MYYYDDFGKAFETELDFHEYLDEIDKRARWLLIPAKKLRVLTGGGSAGYLNGNAGDEADYAIISMPELFMIASAYISAEQEAAFCHGYADHYLAQITWQMSNSELTKTYGELMEEQGKKPFGDIKVFIRVVSSDVGASGANIFYSMMDGDHTIILGEALRIKHQYSGAWRNLPATWNPYSSIISRS